MTLYPLTFLGVVLNAVTISVRFRKYSFLVNIDKCRIISQDSVKCMYVMIVLFAITENKVTFVVTLLV